MISIRQAFDAHTGRLLELKGEAAATVVEDANLVALTFGADAPAGRNQRAAEEDASS